MSDEEPSIVERIEQYRETCREEGRLKRRLQDLRYEKSRQFAMINHDLGTVGQFDRDSERFGSDHFDELDIEPPKIRPGTDK